MRCYLAFGGTLKVTVLSGVLGQEACSQTDDTETQHLHLPGQTEPWETVWTGYTSHWDWLYFTLHSRGNTDRPAGGDCQNWVLPRTGHWALDTGHWTLVTLSRGDCHPASSNWFSVPGHFAVSLVDSGDL